LHKSLLCCRQQSGSDAPATESRADRQSVQVAPPAVPARYDRADHLTVHLGDQHCGGVPLQQSPHTLPVVGNADALGCVPPEGQQAVDVVSAVLANRHR
jgi:hypothetical protein